MSSINNVVMEAQVLEALRTCYDPEIPVNIYELDWYMRSMLMTKVSSQLR